MSTSDPDVTPDLEETEEHETDNDEEDKVTLTKILQKISDCQSSSSIVSRISSTDCSSLFHAERTRSEETARMDYEIGTTSQRTTAIAFIADHRSIQPSGHDHVQDGDDG